MDRTMRITGSAKMSVEPDTMRILIKVTKVKMVYEETLAVSTELSAQIKSSMEKLGLAREGLKTIAWNISTKYEDYKDEQNEWQKRFSGYELDHQMKIEFAADNRLLGQVLGELAQYDICPTLDIEYFVLDTEACKKELLKKAVRDSKEKAMLLAEAAGVTLEGIIRIDYSWGDGRTPLRPRGNQIAVPAMLRSAAAYNVDITPSEVELSDTVTVVWKLKE